MTSHWPAAHCNFSPVALLQSRPPERWMSGLSHTPGKRAWGKTHRGFESRPLRQLPNEDRVKIGPTPQTTRQYICACRHGQPGIISDRLPSEWHRSTALCHHDPLGPPGALDRHMPEFVTACRSLPPVADAKGQGDHAGGESEVPPGDPQLLGECSADRQRRRRNSDCVEDIIGY